jgi:hypothetical protein
MSAEARCCLNNRPLNLSHAEVPVMNLDDHPTVRRLSKQVREGENQKSVEMMLDSAGLRRLALDCGADDVGVVEIARPGLDPQREDILRNYPWTKSLPEFSRIQHSRAEFRVRSLLLLLIAFCLVPFPWLGTYA